MARQWVCARRVTVSSGPVPGVYPDLPDSARRLGWWIVGEEGGRPVIRLAREPSASERIDLVARGAEERP